MKRMIRKLLVLAALCLLCAVPVSGAQQGSLLLTKVEKQVMLFPVADEQGIPNEDFAGTVENLTISDLTPEVAKKLYQHVQDRELSGEVGTPNNIKEVFFADLELGWYLVCSMGQTPEFMPFLISAPMTIGDKTVYNITAEPKLQSPFEPSQPGGPENPQPNIPQTGAILWPQYLLLILGGVSICLGLVEVIRGREKRYE